MLTAKRGFLKSAAAVSAVVGSGVSKFLVPEARAEAAFSVTHRLSGHPDWRHQHLENERLAAMLASRRDADSAELLALSSVSLREAGPVRGNRYLGLRDYSMDIVQIPYIDAHGTEPQAWLFVNAISLGSQVFQIKGVVFRDGRAYAKVSGAPVILIEDGEIKRMLLKLLLRRADGEGKEGVLEKLPVKGLPRAPCLPVDCDVFCSQSCDLAEGFAAGTLLTGIATVFFPPLFPLPAIFGIAALGLGTACFDCSHKCRLFNWACCRTLRRLGFLVDAV